MSFNQPLFVDKGFVNSIREKAQQRKKSILQNVKPTPQVRGIDVLREIPGTIKSMGQDILRSAATIGTETAQLFLPKSIEPTSKIDSPIKQKLLGSNEPLSFTAIGNRLGVNNQAAPFLGAAMAALDVSPIPGKGAKQVIKKGIKSFKGFKDISTGPFFKRIDDTGKITNIPFKINKTIKKNITGVKKDTNKFITLYHGTTKANKAKILKDGFLKANKDHKIYLTGDPAVASDKTYLGGEVIKVKVLKSKLTSMLDNEIPGTADYRHAERLDGYVFEGNKLPIKTKEIAEAPQLFKGFDDMTTTILNKLKGKSVTSKQEILDFTNSPDVRQVEREIFREELANAPRKVNVKEFADKIKTRLLPLKVDDALRTKTYKYTRLKPEIRGNVANYFERVYESPIKTSAGDIHFNSLEVPQGHFRNLPNQKPTSFPNYFAHTRIEDLSPNQGTFQSNIVGAADSRVGDTRRVIEIQSDLMQKGRLEKEIADLPNAPFSGGKKLLTETEIKQLQPYRNTWHERIIREEIKQAAIDGKTKLQFPTGETAMKVEGLGQQDLFQDVMTSEKLTPQNMKVGKEIYINSALLNDNWVITDVLGDGKFKAVQKIYYDDVTTGANEIINKKSLKEVLINESEAFDISGKVDTSNPIYKFYEKDVQKFLKKFQGKRITDKQGVDWIEVPITAQQAKEPVQSFGKAPLKTILGGAATGTITTAAAIPTTETYKKKLFLGPNLPPIERATPKTIKLDPPTKENTIGGVNFSKYASAIDAIPKMRRFYKEMKEIDTVSEIDDEIKRIKRISGKDTLLTGSIIINATNRYGVNPVIILAVIKKETSMGTNLLTKNNFGNILNTDKGGKKEYPTIQEGVNAVAREIQRRMVKSIFK